MSLLISHRVQRHFRYLFLLGVLLSFILLMVSLVSLGNQIAWIKYVSKKSFSGELSSQFVILESSLWTETELRITDNTNTAAIDAANKEWNDALSSLLYRFPDNFVPLLNKLTESFKTATTRGEILLQYIQLNVYLGTLTFQILRGSLDSTAAATLDTLSVSSSEASLGFLMGMLTYLYGKDPDFPLDSHTGIMLVVQYNAAKLTPIFCPTCATLNEQFATAVTDAESLIEQLVGFQASTKTIELISITDLNKIENYLENMYASSADIPGVSYLSLKLFIVSTFLSLVALLFCVGIFYFYCRRTRQARALVDVFEDAKSRKLLQQQYLPVITGLQAVRHPELRTNELTRMFSIAACFADLLRTITPQLLFGHGKKSSKEWSLLEERVNLSASKPRHCPHVVAVEVTLEPHFREEISFYERNLAEQMEMLNEVFRIVVSETNQAGGLVVGVRGNLSILTLWNTLWTAKNVELIALRTAFRIQHRLTRVCACPRVLIGIASGPAVLGKIDTGNRKYASALGSVFAFLDAVRSTGEAIGCNIVIDRPTNRRLPRSVARLLKPLVVLRVQLPSGTSSCVMYTVDQLDSQVSETQRAMYTKCFSLYQNNLYNEATIAYERYLYQYPDDRVARWVYEVVVRPQYELRTRVNPSSGNALKYSSGDILDMGL